MDAASLYPNLMRHYGLLSRRVVGKDRERFGDLIDLRVKVYKPKGDKRAEGLKLVLNGGFGVMGFEKSDMYDPVNFCSVTILGQLLITDLLEKLERHIELIQSNTDGVFFRLRDKTAHGLETCRKIVTAFEKRTMLEMEWTEFERMYQRDISNYVAKTVSGGQVQGDLVRCKALHGNTLPDYGPHTRRPQRRRGVAAYGHTARTLRHRDQA